MNPVQIGVQPRLANLKPDEEPLRSAGEELSADLREVAQLQMIDEDVPEPGKKGQWSDLVVAIGGPSAVAGIIRIFGLWLRRDRRRSLTLTRELGGKRQLRVEVAGDTVSDQTIRDAVQRLLDAS